MKKELMLFLSIYSFSYLSEFANASSDALHGSWISNCILQRGDPYHPESNQRKVEFSESKLTTSETHFSDPKCKDKVYTMIFTQSYQTDVESLKPLSKGIHSLDLTILKTEVVSHKAGFKPPTVPEGFKTGVKLYNIYKHDKGNLRFGDYNSETLEARPTAPGEVLFKLTFPPFLNPV